MVNINQTGVNNEFFGDYFELRINTYLVSQFTTAIDFFEKGQKTKGSHQSNKSQLSLVYLWEDCMTSDMYSQSPAKTKPKKHTLHKPLNTGESSTYYNMKTYTSTQQRQCTLFSTSRELSQGLG